MSVHMYACMHACMHGWMDGWMDGCMYVCMYVCMYKIYIYIYIYICNVCTHTYPSCGEGKQSMVESRAFCVAALDNDSGTAAHEP